MDHQAAVAADMLPAFFDLRQHLIGSSSELGAASMVPSIVVRLVAQALTTFWAPRERHIHGYRHVARLI
jgi:hypothetical protein